MAIVEAASLPPRLSATVPGDPWTQPGASAPRTPHQAASIGRRMAFWRPTASGPNSVVGLSQPELIRRSRDLRRNSPSGKRAMDLLTGHICGLGIKPRSLCPNQRVREALAELWADWTTVADADQTGDFYGLQSTAVSEMIEGGEAFVRLRPRKLSDGLPVPLQLQLLPAEQVPLSYNVAYGNNSVQQGIERDPIGRRAGFWVYPRHPFDALPLANQAIDMIPARIDAQDMAHLFLVQRIGQLRGLPWLTAAMTTLRQIDDYLDAELLRKQMVAMMVGFIETELPSDLSTEEIEQRYGRVFQRSADEPPSVEMEPGSMTVLKPGEKVQFNAPADPGNNFAPFLQANNRAVAAAADVLYEELSGDWSGTNDRTFRAAFETFKRLVRQWQFNTVCVQFNYPIWLRFIDFAQASGALSVPKSVSDADLRRVEWRPERWGYIQPVQDIEASGLAIGLGLTSRAAEVAERGDDIEVVDSQIAADRERERELGLEFGTGLTKASSQSVNFGVPGAPPTGAAANTEPAPLDTPANPAATQPTE